MGRGGHEYASPIPAKFNVGAGVGNTRWGRYTQTLPITHKELFTKIKK